MKQKKLKKGQYKDIEYISIQFENCECADIPRKYLHNIYLSNIRKNISICINAVIESWVADNIWIVIDKEYADTHNAGFGSPCKWDVPITERLTKHNDITNIYIYYNDGTEERITAYWDGDDDYHNPAQTVTIERDEDRYDLRENVCVSISKEV